MKEKYDRILISMPSALNKQIRLHIEFNEQTFSGFVRMLAKKELDQKNKEVVKYEN